MYNRLCSTYIQILKSEFFKFFSNLKCKTLFEYFYISFCTLTNILNMHLHQHLWTNRWCFMLNVSNDIYSMKNATRKGFYCNHLLQKFYKRSLFHQIDSTKMKFFFFNFVTRQILNVTNLIRSIVICIIFSYLFVKLFYLYFVVFYLLNYETNLKYSIFI